MGCYPAGTEGRGLLLSLGPPALHHLHGVVQGVHGDQAGRPPGGPGEGSQDHPQVYPEDKCDRSEPGLITPTGVILKYGEILDSRGDSSDCVCVFRAELD